MNIGDIKCDHISSKSTVIVRVKSNEESMISQQLELQQTDIYNKQNMKEKNNYDVNDGHDDKKINDLKSNTYYDSNKITSTEKGENDDDIIIYGDNETKGVIINNETNDIVYTEGLEGR